MEIDHNRIQDLVDRPSESLAVEIKAWIDPDSLEGQAKIVRSALALRNFGGGYLLIGFDDKTLQPDLVGGPSDVRAAFHVDKIQGLIGKFASVPFEVGVRFGERDGKSFPVLVIPAGLRTPVVAKADLLIEGKRHVATDEIYVRTLRANNTPSTAKASWKDWEALVDVCFDNREADIGRFLRRHLAGRATADLIGLLAPIRDETRSEQSARKHLNDLLDTGEKRFFELVNERHIALEDVGWWEVAAIIDGKIPQHGANATFLNLLDASNPSITGWPVWLDSRSFADPALRPFVADGKWETLMVIARRHIDFQQMDPRGKFYLRRALEDDLPFSECPLPPKAAFDFGLPIYRTAEAIAVCLAFAKGMGCDPNECSLQVAFRWKGLRGRELSSWATPRVMPVSGRHSHQDQVLIFCEVDLDMPLSAIGGLLADVLKPLYEIFDGFELRPNVVEDLSKRHLEHR